MYKTRMIGVLVLLAVLVLSCRNEPVPESQTSAPLEDHLELRAYAVPDGLGERVGSLLRSLLSSGQDEPIGRVSTDPMGRIVILAPEAIHEGIAELLSEIQQTDIETTLQPLSYQVDHWLVLGRPSDEHANTSQASEIAPVLDTLSATQGTQEYAVLEHLGLFCLENETAAVDGLNGRIRQTLTQANDNILADVSVRVRDASWNTRIRLSPDQFIVLGQVGFESPLMRNPFGEEDQMSLPSLPLVDDPTNPPASTRPDRHQEWIPDPGTTLYYILRVRISDDL